MQCDQHSSCRAQEGTRCRPGRSSGRCRLLVSDQNAKSGRGLDHPRSVGRAASWPRYRVWRVRWIKGRSFAELYASASLAGRGGWRHVERLASARRTASARTCEPVTVSAAESPETGVLEDRIATLAVLAVLVRGLDHPAAAARELKAELRTLPDVDARVRFLAARLGLPEIRPSRLAEVWGAALAGGRTPDRRELLELARRAVVTWEEPDPEIGIWRRAIFARLEPTLSSRGTLEVFTPETPAESRQSHLELQPLLADWPRRLLHDRKWAYADSPLPDMAPYRSRRSGSTSISSRRRRPRLPSRARLCARRSTCDTRSGTGARTRWSSRSSGSTARRSWSGRLGAARRRSSSGSPGG